MAVTWTVDRAAERGTLTIEADGLLDESERGLRDILAAMGSRRRFKLLLDMSNCPAPSLSFSPGLASLLASCASQFWTLRVAILVNSDPAYEMARTIAALAEGTTQGLRIESFYDAARATSWL
jgi:hypothetical protein